jgi:hypothetical protein
MVRSHNMLRCREPVRIPFRQMFRSNRRMHRFAVAASIVTLLIVVYIGLGKPSWPAIAHYLSLWVPGLKL